jgi:hypothetical protein
MSLVAQILGSQKPSFFKNWQASLVQEGGLNNFGDQSKYSLTSLKFGTCLVKKMFFCQ